MAGRVKCFETSRKSVPMPLYDNFWARYSFSRISYSDSSQIKMHEKKFYLSLYSNSLSVSLVRVLLKYWLIRHAEFHYFNPFYLDCLFKFDLWKTFRKCVDFVNYFVVWCKSTTSEVPLMVTNCQSSQGWDLASVTDEMKVQHRCCRGIFAIVLRYAGTNCW